MIIFRTVDQNNSRRLNWKHIVQFLNIAVNIYNGNEKAENVISDLVRIYIGASFIIIGIIYKLGKNK